MIVKAGECVNCNLCEMICPEFAIFSVAEATGYRGGHSRRFCAGRRWRVTTATPAGVLTGAHFLDGDFACGEGAMAAGCRFVAGYPITPSTEVVERIGRRFPTMGGIFIQMEDELASMAAVVGAAWTGTKSMTVTSGPGFSLMMENIGLAAMMETPCVIVNVQRAGPSTGLPTMVGQADMMQARWGSHGDYELIALCPQSPQEAFESHHRRLQPLRALPRSGAGHDGRVRRAHDREGRDTDRPTEIEIVSAHAHRADARETTRPYFGKRERRPGVRARRRRVPLPHHRADPRRARLPHAMTVECHSERVHHLVDKIKNQRRRHHPCSRKQDIEGADVIVVCYGITARVARLGAEIGQRKRGIKVGVLRLD